jgi:hypothetical protein
MYHHSISDMDHHVVTSRTQQYQSTPPPRAFLTAPYLDRLIKSLLSAQLLTHAYPLGGWPLQQGAMGFTLSGWTYLSDQLCRCQVGRLLDTEVHYRPVTDMCSGLIQRSNTRQPLASAICDKADIMESQRVPHKPLVHW